MSTLETCKTQWKVIMVLILLGNLFKSTQVIKSTSELLFFITARIKPANPLEFLSETTPDQAVEFFAQ